MGLDMTSMNQEQARFNMVEQQIRTWDVLNPNVLEVLHETPREKFVPDAFINLAYADTEIELGNGQVMDKPLIDARLLEALDVQKDEVVLEIGTGSGYLTALLAKLAKHVDSVDLDSSFVEKAKQALSELNIENVTLATADAANGVDAKTPYDAIACTSSFPEAVTEGLMNNLKVGGRMFVVIGQAPIMEATLIRRISETEWSHEAIFETETSPIQGVAAKPKFIL